MDPSKVDSNNLCGVYGEIASLLGFEVALQMYNSFHGQQVTFPVHFYSSEYITQLIKEEYDGTNIRQLATKYNYSERWVRKIVNANKEGK